MRDGGKGGKIPPPTVPRRGRKIFSDTRGSPSHRWGEGTHRQEEKVFDWKVFVENLPTRTFFIVLGGRETKAGLRGKKEDFGERPPHD